MGPFQPSPTAGNCLKGRVVVVSGGSNGIGGAIVRALHTAGALVVFGDRDETAASSLLAELNGADDLPTFVPTDVTSYEANLRLFKTATDLYGRVDHAIPVAGVSEGKNWFGPETSIASVQDPPSTTTIDVNLTAVCYFARIALAYMRESPRMDGAAPQERSLLLMSSTTGFKEAPGTPMYQVTKHGVLGLMRSLRVTSPSDQGVRVNALCPWMTDTGFVQGWGKEWRAAGLPMNEPEDVAAAAIGLLGGTPEVNGLAIMIEGGQMWEMETELATYEATICGERFAKEWPRGQKLLDDMWAQPNNKW